MSIDILEVFLDLLLALLLLLLLLEQLQLLLLLLPLLFPVFLLHSFGLHLCQLLLHLLAFRLLLHQLVVHDLLLELRLPPHRAEISLHPFLLVSLLLLFLRFQDWVEPSLLLRRGWLDHWREVHCQLWLGWRGVHYMMDLVVHLWQLVFLDLLLRIVQGWAQLQILLVRNGHVRVFV